MAVSDRGSSGRSSMLARAGQDDLPVRRRATLRPRRGRAAVASSSSAAEQAGQGAVPRRLVELERERVLRGLVGLGGVAGAAHRLPGRLRELVLAGYRPSGRPRSGRRRTRTRRSWPASSRRRPRARSERAVRGRAQAERLERGRAGDAVGLEAVGALEALDRAARLRAHHAVGLDAERLLDLRVVTFFGLAWVAPAVVAPVAFGRRPRRGGADGQHGGQRQRQRRERRTWGKNSSSTCGTSVDSLGLISPTGLADGLARRPALRRRS